MTARLTPQDDQATQHQAAAEVPVQTDLGAWGAEPLIEIPTTVPGGELRYIIRWKEHFRTPQASWLAMLASNPTFDPNWHVLTKTAYTTQCPFPGRT